MAGSLILWRMLTWIPSIIFVDSTMFRAPAHPDRPAQMECLEFLLTGCGCRSRRLLLISEKYPAGIVILEMTQRRNQTHLFLKLRT